MMFSEIEADRNNFLEGNKLPDGAFIKTMMVPTAHRQAWGAREAEGVR